jgi:hypothetical protein
MLHLTFASVSENVATTLLDTLPMTSTDGADSVYCQLNDILSAAVEQQAKSSLIRWAEFDILSPGRSMVSRQGTMMEIPTARTTSSLAWAPNHLRPSNPSRYSERPSHRQAHRGHEGEHSEHCGRNLHLGKHNDRQRCSLSPKGPGPKVFGSSMCNACFPKCF